MSNRPKQRRLAVVGSAAPGIGVRMRFDSGQDAAFRRTADVLVAEFQSWLQTHGVAGEPSDAELMLDWRYQYEDGVLDVWTVAHVSEFLMHWCPRKLSAAPDQCASMPGTATAFVDFLAHTGRLAPTSDRPSAVRVWCERNRATFLREMSNPDNFGMAKSLFAGVGGLEAGRDLDAGGVAELVQRVNGLDPATFDSIMGRVQRQAAGLPAALAPVRLPAAQERLAAVRTAPMLRWVRGLAQYCALPGIALTGTGNLRLADARRLVEELDIGDDVAGLRSAAELPGLDRVFLLALETGAVRRHSGKLVAVGRFAGLDDVAAHEKIVRAALTPSARSGGYVHQVRAALSDARPLLLAGLLHAGPDGLADDDAAELLARFLVDRLPGIADYADQLMPRWIDDVLGDLVELGMIETVSDDEPCDECDEHWSVVLSAAGVAPAVDLVRTLGVEVPLRPDPVGATANELAALAGVGHPEDWQDDLGKWLAAQAEPAEAAGVLLAAVAAAETGPVSIVLAITAVEASAPAHAVEAVRTLLGGPCDGLALTWLLDSEVIDPAEVAPERLVLALVDSLAFTLDAGGEEELVGAFALGPDGGPMGLLEDLWRLDHPRLAEILDVLGARLPDKAVAKSARRSAVKLRSRLGQRAAGRA